MEYETIVLLVLTIISSILAIWQKKIATVNKNEKEKSDETAKLEKYNNTITIEFFDPNNSNWNIPEWLPSSTYNMDVITKQYLIDGLSEADTILVNAKIEYAEKNKLVYYEIEYSGGWYIIQYGLIKTQIQKNHIE